MDNEGYCQQGCSGVLMLDKHYIHAESGGACTLEHFLSIGMSAENMFSIQSHSNDYYGDLICFVDVSFMHTSGLALKDSLIY